MVIWLERCVLRAVGGSTFGEEERGEEMGIEYGVVGERGADQVVSCWWTGISRK